MPHDGELVKEEAYDLKENLYFVQEVLLLLDIAGVSRRQGRRRLHRQPGDQAVVPGSGLVVHRRTILLGWGSTNSSQHR